MQRHGGRGLPPTGPLVETDSSRQSTFSVETPTPMEDPKTLAQTRKPKLAPGIRLLQACSGGSLSFEVHRALVLAVTFVAYAAYHASRRPISIVKPVLHQPDRSYGNCTGTEASSDSLSIGSEEHQDWPPFDGKNGQEHLGNLDLSFLTAYAVGVVISGHIGDHCDLRQFLLIGMVGSGLTTSIYALGFFLEIHSFPFYLISQMLTGLFQSTGWPIVVAIVAHWFGKGKRGLVLGIWNAHTSIGNALGTFLAGSVLGYGWGWSFVLLGVLMCVAGVFVWSFVVVNPSDVSLVGPNDEVPTDESLNYEDENTVLLGNSTSSESNAVPGSKGLPGIGLVRAMGIPGVIPFALSLFFSKLVAYTFLFWLPFYTSSLCFKTYHLSDKQAGNLSMLFDFGGIIGGAMAGFLSDWSQCSGTVAAGFIIAAVPVLYLFDRIGHLSIGLNVVLLFVSGMVVNGPYSLITSAVSADLGSHKSLEGNKQLLATVTAIIDGMGSFGAALGPKITSEILGLSKHDSFHGVFAMLEVACLLSCLLLSGVVWKEMKAWRNKETIEQERIQKLEKDVIAVQDEAPL